MARIPPEFIDQLLARVDIVDVIDKYVPLKRQGSEYQALCPFHNEKTPSFTVSPAKQFYHCFGCGAHGSAIGFLMNHANLEFVPAVEELASIAGMEVPREAGHAARSDELAGLYAVLARAEDYFRHQLPGATHAVDYLKRRGLTGEIAARFKLGYAPDRWDGLLKELAPADDPARLDQLVTAGLAIRRSGGGCYDRFRDRVMFPIHDQRGRCIGFGGRIVEAGEPKYLNSPESPVFHKGRELYGLAEARRAAGDAGRILVVEGYMDVIALAQHGVGNAVATLGTATTPEHVEKLFRAAPEIVFCFDGDAAGRRAAWRALRTCLPRLGENRYVAFLFLPEGQDPDSLVRAEGPGVFQSRERSVALAEFLFEHLEQSVDAAAVDGPARLVDSARPLLATVPAGAYRQLLIEQLARRARLDAGAVADLVGRGTGAQHEGRPPAAARPPRSARGRGRPSLVRTAITRLLQRPELAADAGDPETYRRMQQPGAGLLADLLEVAQQQAGVSGAALVERFRDSPDGVHLARLMADSEPMPETAVTEEFLGALARLRESAARAAPGDVLPPRPSDLSAEARDALLRRLGRAHRPDAEK